jgi:tetratricopeptide (TPR) repeat protein
MNVVMACSLTAQGTGLRHADSPTSAPPEAQKHFLRGLLLLHSFEWEDAGEEFRIAREIAPGFAMAYWGEALTFNGPLTFYQDRESARATLQLLAPTAAERQAKAPTDREKRYLQTVEVLFGEGEKEDRDFAYAGELRKLHEQYPDDPDAASLYSLALMATCHRGRDFSVYMKAAAIAEQVLEKYSAHPGALHYLIHSYDDPIHAPLGLRAARTYARVSPPGAHALHMPSHIFVAMGMWDDAVASNEKSWAASESRTKSKNLPLEERGYHSLWWLEYGYLQQGRFEDARRVLRIAEQDARVSPSRLIRFHLVQLRAAYRIETGDPEIAFGRIETGDLDLSAGAADLLAAGLISLDRGQRPEAETALAELRKLRQATPQYPSSESAHAHDHVYPGDAQAAEIMETQLSAMLLMADGKSNEAVQLMREATAAENRMRFEFGPPVPVKPSHELFGEILLQLGRPEAAREQFEIALKRAPKRALSLLGLARSLTQMGDREAARQAYTELRRMWHRADTALQKAIDDSLARL